MRETSLARVVHAARARLGLSRRVLAYSLGVHRNTARNGEQGLTRPDAERPLQRLRVYPKSTTPWATGQGRTRETVPGPAAMQSICIASARALRDGVRGPG